MKQKKKIIPRNFLDKKPLRKPGLSWTADEDGTVTLEMENRGIANRLLQLLLRKPRVSYIHLDTMGSFLWPLLDGETDLTDLGKLVEVRFGDEAKPLYERLARYMQTLESCGLIVWAEERK